MIWSRETATPALRARYSEQAELERRQVEGLAIDRDLAGGEIHLHLAETLLALLLGVGLRLLALGEDAHLADVGLEPRDQLADPDRLGEVVVGPGVEAADRTRLVVPAGDEDDRHHPVEGAQTPAGLDAGDVGEHPVEEDRDRPVPGEGLDRLQTASRAGDAEALLLDQVGDQVGGGLVVLHDQDHASGTAHLQ